MKIIDKEAWIREKELMGEFLAAQGKYGQMVLGRLLGWNTEIKEQVVKLMYRQRGRFSRTFIHGGMAALAFLAVVLSGRVESIISAADNKERDVGWAALADNQSQAETQISQLQKGEITQYRVNDGDTVSSIARQFNVSIDTIIWENNLKSVDNIKPGQILRILPDTGVRYTIKRGETIYGIAKDYGVDAQAIADYPFNTFANDETFALTAGQDLFIPGGIKPREVIVDTQRYLAKTVAPIPGVVGEGNFMWPTSGHVSQKFYWYHQATDIANPSNPPVVAAQTGTVVTAGWNGGGYGNYVIIDHGNGYKTLYGHMLNGSLLVKAGDRVKQGQQIGTMGSTGRSTGTHLHFEIKTAGGNLDPLKILK